MLHKEMPGCAVVAMTFTIRRFAVQTQNGILLVFPMNEGNPIWDGAIVIVVGPESFSKVRITVAVGVHADSARTAHSRL